MSETSEEILQNTNAEDPTRTIFHIRRVPARTGAVIVGGGIVSPRVIRKIRWRQGEGDSGRSDGYHPLVGPSIRPSPVLRHGIAHISQAQWRRSLRWTPSPLSRTWFPRAAKEVEGIDGVPDMGSMVRYSSFEDERRARREWAVVAVASSRDHVQE